MQIPAFYQQPPGPSVVPWPQATSPGYFEAAAAVSGASNFVHFVSNPQQQAFAGEGEAEREREREMSILPYLYVHGTYWLHLHALVPSSCPFCILFM